MLYTCLYCEKVIHCDLASSCAICVFGPESSVLCRKLWLKLRDGELLTCETCHEKITHETIAIFTFLLTRLFNSTYKHVAEVMATEELLFRNLLADTAREMIAGPEIKMPLFLEDESEVRKHHQGLQGLHSSLAKTALKRKLRPPSIWSRRKTNMA